MSDSKEILILSEDDTMQRARPLQNKRVVSMVVIVFLGSENIHSATPQTSRDRTIYVLIHIEANHAVDASCCCFCRKRASNSARVGWLD